jgi:hypothetical protein
MRSSSGGGNASWGGAPVGRHPDRWLWTAVDVWQHGGMPRPPRPVQVVLDELRTVEAYLVDAPPHSGAGQRDDLVRRAQQLRRELAEARRRRGAGRDDA